MERLRPAARRSPRSQRGDSPGLPARQAAATAVADALERGVALDEARAWTGLPPADAALARAIAVTTFRRFGGLRLVLAARLSQGLPRQERLLAILATGAAQILFMDVPDHAAVDLAVRLAANDSKTRHLTGLVNAVLRRIGRERDAALAEIARPETDLPDWLAARWTATYGPDRTAAIAEAQRAGAPIDLTPKADAAGWAERLGGTRLPTGSIRLADRGAIDTLPGYADGAWWVQDAAAALPARLLGARPGERVLDLCAAPGGKTAQLAAAGAAVTAVDRSGPRLARFRTNLARLRLVAEVVEADGLSFEAPPFDAVILDAPCTGTGTIRRHPEIAWIKAARDLASLQTLQTRLLGRAAGLVRPGGRLVYCVCSLEPEEGEAQIAAFLAGRPDFARDPVPTGSEGIEAALLTPDGDLRTVPDQWPAPAGGRGGLDGFFAARLRRLA